ncbi:MAG: hypothetical protein KAJ36_04235 [Candidatus Thorarchaeota archaeon]|nr:hypothetical protein [Candidatus Thorarchaeota archaeon]
MKDDDKDLETAFKVVAIMQTITEELDESSKRLWRKMLGLSDKPSQSPEDGTDKSES